MIGAAATVAGIAVGVGVSMTVGGGDGSPGDQPPPPTSSSPTSPSPASIEGTYTGTGEGTELRLVIEPAIADEYTAYGTQEGTHGLDPTSCEPEIGEDVDAAEAVISGDGSSYAGTYIDLYTDPGGGCIYSTYEVTIDLIGEDTVEMCAVSLEGCATYQRME